MDLLYRPLQPCDFDALKVGCTSPAPAVAVRVHACVPASRRNKQIGPPWLVRRQHTSSCSLSLTTMPSSTRRCAAWTGAFCAHMCACVRACIRVCMPAQLLPPVGTCAHALAAGELLTRYHHNTRSRVFSFAAIDGRSGGLVGFVTARQQFLYELEAGVRARTRALAPLQSPCWPGGSVQLIAPPGSTSACTQHRAGPLLLGPVGLLREHRPNSVCAHAGRPPWLAEARRGLGPAAARQPVCG